MFKGIQKVSLIDFPGYIASTLFTGGCNFRCSWCHNWDLVDPEKFHKIPDLAPEEVKDFLSYRKGKIQGVCVTGGEPTIWKEPLTEFLHWCKEEGLKTKLDTNGSRPQAIQYMIEQKVLDFIAMDLKNTFNLYSQTVGLDMVDTDLIRQSIEIIQSSGINHQFRTTLVPGLVDKNMITEFYAFLEEPITFQDYRQPGKY